MQLTIDDAGAYPFRIKDLLPKETTALTFDIVERKLPSSQVEPLDGGIREKVRDEAWITDRCAGKYDGNVINLLLTRILSLFQEFSVSLGVDLGEVVEFLARLILPNCPR